jgi:hypothetical protein
MGKEKSLSKISYTSLERVSKQISIVDKILSKKQKKNPKKELQMSFLILKVLLK